MGVGHYENFPVASLLAPPHLRPAIRAIYRFARTADDLADEGNMAPAGRLRDLGRLRTALDGIAAGRPGDWPDLAAAVSAHSLPLSLFRDLLSAFEQDVVTTRYASYADLRDYCRRSADPVGRLLLALYRRSDAQSIVWSDSICTGLQLTNFWQDVAVDWTKGRVYLPQEDLVRFGVSEPQIAAARVDSAWTALLRFEVERARQLLVAGAPLARTLGGRIGLELQLVVHGGLRILERIDQAHGDVFRRRPLLGMADWLLMGWRSLTGAPPVTAARS
jgi:squalene synthase HpnC